MLCALASGFWSRVVSWIPSLLCKLDPVMDRSMGGVLELNIENTSKFVNIPQQMILFTSSGLQEKNTNMSRHAAFGLKYYITLCF